MQTYCIAASENWQLFVGGVGFVGMVLSELIHAVRSKRLPINLERTPFIVYAIGFGVFTLLDFDFCPDLFPLLPVVGLGIGWAIWGLLRGLAAIFANVTNMRVAKYATLALGILVALIIADVNVVDAFQYKVVGLMYRNQLGLVARAETYLRPQDRLLSLR